MALIAGCGQPPAPPPAPAVPPYNTTLNMKQVMSWVIDPAADVVWESVAIIITEKGENQKAPKTDDEWAAVRNGAATLVESGNLLMMQTRTRDDKTWMAAAKRLSDAANIALQAAEKKDVAALFDSGATIFNACSACHANYRVGEEAPDAKPAATATPGNAAK
jgi:mono/diheme cytochrome c family protein